MSNIDKIPCPKCGADGIKAGFRRLVIGWKQRYKCSKCSHRFVVEQPIPEDKRTVLGPKILFLDIETAPMTVYTFQLKTDYISPDNIITPTFIICWAAKWFEEEQVFSGVISSKEIKTHDDKRICVSIHELLNKADLVVAYNGDRFDFPKLNYRFIIHGLLPPSHYRTIDPLKSMRSQFRFDSNKLDFVNGELGIERKLHTDFQLWKDCMAGDVDALARMQDYNKNDVVILEQNYLKIRPWMRSHPNMGTYYDWEGEICKVCGSKNVREVLDKYQFTAVSKFSLYRCNDCGAESRGRNNELTKEKRKGLLR